jgi:beta-xylosidase
MFAAACVPPPPPPPPLFTPNPPVQRLDNGIDAAPNQSFPDPAVVYSPNGTAQSPGQPAYVAFSTTAFYPSPFDLPLVPIAVAQQLNQWRRPGQPAAAGAFAPYDPANDALAGHWPTWQLDPYVNGPLLRNWSPAVHKFGATWVLYFTAPDASSPDQCIGVATSSSVDGPYQPVDTAPLECMHGWGGAIDPSVIVDAGGQPWLLFKNDGNCCKIGTFIWSQPLTSDGLGFASGSQKNLLLALDQSWEDGSKGGREPWKRLIEAPSMVYAAGAYWLFYSANWWDSANYAVGYARCSSPAGGCSKPQTRQLLGSGRNGAGPGGEDVFADASGQLWMAYHAWDPGSPGSELGGTRTLRFSRLTFANGAPVLGAGP